MTTDVKIGWCGGTQASSSFGTSRGVPACIRPSTTRCYVTPALRCAHSATFNTFCSIRRPCFLFRHTDDLPVIPAPAGVPVDVLSPLLLLPLFPPDVPQLHLKPGSPPMTILKTSRMCKTSLSGLFSTFCRNDGFMTFMRF